MEAGTEEVEEYIPGESRFNWNGVVSSDGTQIAFLSTPRQGTGSPQLYVMPTNGGDPVAVEIAMEFAYVPKALKPSYAQYPTAGVGEVCTTLLDWR